MPPKIAVASELRELLTEQTGDFEIVWIDSSEDTPAVPLEGLVTLLTRTVGSELMSRHPSLRIVANVATGFDNIDMGEATERGIVVTNTPDVLTEATADLTFALVLAVMRRLPAGMDLMKNEDWTGWHPTQLLGKDLNGATLGVVGAGRIGAAVAGRARGFGMNIVYASPARSARPALIDAAHLDLDEVLGKSHCVTLHVPLTSGTSRLIGTRELGLMKPGAVLINTSRGGIVDEDALLRALDSGHLMGAGLDVFEGEPDVRSALIGHPKVIALPHIGSATVGTRRAMANLAFRNVVAVLSGREALTPVVVDATPGPS